MDIAVELGDEPLEVFRPGVDVCPGVEGIEYAQLSGGAGHERYDSGLCGYQQPAHRNNRDVQCYFLSTALD